LAALATHPKPWAYVLGRVNPFTVSAAVLGTLAMAYYKGAQESDAFVKAITMSGNAAGVTAGQIAIMTQTVSKMSGSTVGASADALAQFAASGDISASRMADLTASAIKFERVGGAAIKDTVAAFVALAKDPVAASEDLTKKYNYLTDAVYVQIKALVEQGDSHRMTLRSMQPQRTKPRPLGAVYGLMLTQCRLGSFGTVGTAHKRAGGRRPDLVVSLSHRAHLIRAFNALCFRVRDSDLFFGG
jgi:hypothetical protein